MATKKSKKTHRCRFAPFCSAGPRRRHAVAAAGRHGAAAGNSSLRSSPFAMPPSVVLQPSLLPPSLPFKPCAGKCAPPCARAVLVGRTDALASGNTCSHV